MKIPKLEEYLNQVKQRAESATPGPWTSGILMFTKHSTIISCANPHKPQTVTVIENGNHDNEQFIAHSRNDVPKLLEIIEVLADTVKGIEYSQTWDSTIKEFCQLALKRAEEIVSAN